MSLSELRDICEEKDGCWIFPRAGAFRCRPPHPDQASSQPPMFAPHRWAWMLANNRLDRPMNPKVGIRRRCHHEGGCTGDPSRCLHSRCCNPEHLYLATSSGIPLTIEEADEYGSSDRGAGLVLNEDLAAIAEMCDVDSHGCWLGRKAGPIACRAMDDARPDRDLPKMAIHRWTWSVAHGRASDLLPGNLIQIRRRCGSSTCCNPEHLFLSTPDGTELSIEEADEYVKAAQARKSVIDGTGGSSGSPPHDPHDELRHSVSRIDTDPNGAAIGRAQSTSLDTASASGKFAATIETNTYRIRHSYASWILANSPGLIENAAVELAVSIYPWPEFDIEQSLVDAIAGELHPASNLRHPDICQVGIDRLLRLVEVVTELGHDGLAAFYLASARALECATPRLPANSAIYSLIADPLGVASEIAERQFVGFGSTEVAEAKADSARQDLEEVQYLGGLEATAVGALLFKALQTRTDDLGVMLGVAPIAISVRTLLEDCPGIAVLAKLGGHLASLSERNRQIVIERHLSLDPPATLDRLGERFGVTRERVRQIARQELQIITDQFGAELQELSEAVLAPFREKVIRTERLVGTLRLLSTATAQELWSPTIVALFNAEGSWTHTEGWSASTGEAGKLAASLDALLETADGYGSVGDDAVRLHLLEHFLDAEELAVYVRDRLGWVPVGDRWSLRGSKRNRIATALRALGRPATKGEIAAAAGIKEVTQVSNVLGSLPDVVRADKDRWAFAGWVEDPYDGIVGEIEQRIDQYGGAVRLSTLLDEIPSRFGVSESSVRTYVATDAFVVEHGMVRRNIAEYQARQPSTQRGAIELEGLWGQKVVLYERHFQGYSLAVSFDVAYANGVRPGDDLVVPLLGRGMDASVIWRRHNPSRNIDVGRISDALKDMGCVPGDEVVVVPSRESVQLIRTSESEPEGLEIEREERPITTTHPDPASLQVESNRSDGQRYSRASFKDPLLDLLMDD